MNLSIKLKILILLSFLTLLFSKCGNNYNLPEQGVCAHRGANITHPENTLSAFKEAIRLGAHMIEFDVRMSKDGELVIIHDATVDRTTNGMGAVAELNFSELRQLDAGSWKDLKYKGEKIPTFSEVINIMPKNLWLNIHIKGGVEAAKKVAKIIIAENRKHQAVIACKTEAVHAVQQIDNSILICNMERLNDSEAYVDSTIAMKANFIQLKDRADDSLPELTSRLIANGIKINYYGTNSPEKLKRLFKYGVNFPLVDNLKEMMDVTREAGIYPVEPRYE